MEDGEQFLFDLPENIYESEWQNMPEFVQAKQEPYQKIIVRFNSSADVKEFADLIGQKITPKTKSIWHPCLLRGVNSGKGYKSES